MCAVKCELSLTGSAGHLQPATLTADAVCGGAEVKVHTLVWYSAKTAAVGFTHGLTTALCCCRHIEQVPAQRSLKVIVEGNAVALGKKRKRTLKKKEGIYLPTSR